MRSHNRGDTITHMTRKERSFNEQNGGHEHYYSENAKQKLYGLRGSHVILPVKSTFEEQKLSDSDVKWTRPSGEPVEGDHFKVQEMGSLLIKDVDIQDAGKYQCAVRGSGEKGESSVYRFSWTLVVYVLPNLYYAVTLKYKTPTCDNAVKQKKTVDIQQALCASLKCHFKKIAGVCHLSDPDKGLWVTFIIAHPKDFKHPSCDKKCLVRAIVDDMKGSVEQVKTFVEQEAASEEGNLTLSEKDMTLKLESSCPSGFQLKELVCLPCGPGTFSENKSQNCTPCELGTYQPEFAKSKCIFCPRGTVMEMSGAKSKSKCKYQAHGTTMQRFKDANISPGGWILIVLIFFGLFAVMYRLLPCPWERCCAMFPFFSAHAKSFSRTPSFLPLIKQRKGSKSSETGQDSMGRDDLAEGIYLEPQKLHSSTHSTDNKTFDDDVYETLDELQETDVTQNDSNANDPDAGPHYGKGGAKTYAHTINFRSDKGAEDTKIYSNYSNKGPIVPLPPPPDSLLKLTTGVSTKGKPNSQQRKHRPPFLSQLSPIPSVIPPPLPPPRGSVNH